MEILSVKRNQKYLRRILLKAKQFIIFAMYSIKLSCIMTNFEK